jgi:long-chain acyl-CoA synthetase
MTYANDKKCHNAEPGTFNHECGKPAVWIGIKPNGFQVWPREIEEVIATHPAVAEVGVRGFPDMARGEIAVAFVVLRPGASATAEELREHAKAHLAHYKVPGKVVFRSELPKSLIGKVLRRMLTLDEESQTA